MDCEPVVRLRPARAAAGTTPTRATTRRVIAAGRAADLTLTLTSDIRIGLEGPSARARTLLQGGRDPVLRAVLGQPQAARTTTRTPRPGSCGPPTTGSTGWPGATFPDHRWRPLPDPQRADAQGPHVRPDRRDRRRGDHVAAGDPARASGTGTTATAGSGTPRSRSGACTRWASSGRPATTSRSSTDLVERDRRQPADRLRHRRPVRPRASRCSTTCTATRAPGRSGSATPPTPSSRTTSGASCSTRCTCTPSRGTGSTSGSGSWPGSRSSTRWSTGASPTAASGRSAASRSTSPRPS